MSAMIQRFANFNSQKISHGKRSCLDAYVAPVTTMSIPNVDIPLMLDKTLRVRVAATTPPAAKLVVSLFQVSVNGPFAVAGFQFAVDKLSVTCRLPWFLT